MVVGGNTPDLKAAPTEVFDFSERKWRKLPDVPSKRVFAMYAANDKKIFSVGGLNQPAKDGFSDVCEVFDIEKGWLYLCINAK